MNEMKSKQRISSKDELKKTKSICGAGLLSALNVALGYLDFPIAPNLKLGFTYIAAGTCGFMYGPWLGVISGFICDILKYAMMPDGGFFFGYTINEMLAGYIYGAVLYKKNISWQRCLVAKGLVTITCNLLLTPLWLSIMYGKAWIVYAQLRILKNIVLLPLEVFILYSTLQLVKRTIYKKG